MRPSTATLFIICIFSFSSGASPLTAVLSPTDTILPLGGGQLIRTKLVAVKPVVGLRIQSDASSANYTNITLDWELKANGISRQKGSIVNLSLASKRPMGVSLPIRLPPITEDELVLTLRYHYPRKPILAQEEFQLTRWSGKAIIAHPAGELTFSDSNNLFTIQSPSALLRFDKQTGWLQTWQAGGMVLIEDTPGCKSRFWPEATPRLQLFSTSTGTQLVIVRAEYTLPETSCLLHLSYTINATGEMQVEQSLEADTAKQGEPLPCFGMTWMLPALFDSVSYYSGASIPSRENWSDIRWFTITDRSGKGIRVTADSALLTISTRTSAPRLIIDHPAPSYPLPYHNYQYSYKIAPQLPAEKKPPEKKPIK